MADTVTPKLGLTKPEIGASNNTWGTKWNGNADILEAKIVRQTIQWTITGGDDNPASGAGPWQLTRYGNDGLPIDSPISVNRQTGAVSISKLAAPLSMPYQATPAAPPAGEAKIYIDANGNPIIIRPDGSTMHLGLAPGMITYTGGTTPDAGCAFLNGQAISRTANPVLFTRYGTLFGAGDGSTTFNLPDVMGRVIAHYDGAGRLGGQLSAGTMGGVGGFHYHYMTLDQTVSHTHGGGVAGTGSWKHNHGVNHINGGLALSNTIGGGSQYYGGQFGVITVTQSFSLNDADLNHTHGLTIDANGGSNWHNNIQPTIILYAQVKLG